MFHSSVITGEGGEPSPIRLRALLLGAGVQSTTLALMAAHGEIGPMPDCAIFADTHWEPKAVYDHLNWLMSPNVLPFPTAGWSHALFYDDQPVAVVATDTLIRPRVAGLTRQEAVELSRLCAARPDLCRVVLRLWRAFVFPVMCRDHGFRWAVSYQDAHIHSGNLYRFDGWARLTTSRSGTDPRTGRKRRSKIIWGWQAPDCATAGDAADQCYRQGSAVITANLDAAFSCWAAPPR